MFGTDDLRTRWAREHRVWAEVVPSDAIHERGDRWVPTGLQVRLYALCTPGCALDPAQPECTSIYERLAEILAGALPAGLRCTIHSPETALHLRPEAELAPEIELIADLDQEGEPLGRVDPADRQGARRLMENLAAAGVARRGAAVPA
jgi:hypothetical protein